MVIKIEEYEKDGVKMVKEFVGPNKDTITGTIEYAKPNPNLKPYKPEEHINEGAETKNIKSYNVQNDDMLVIMEAIADMYEKLVEVSSKIE